MPRFSFLNRAATPGIDQGSPENAYEVVALRELWGLLSLGFFVLSVTTRFGARLLPDSIPGWGQLPPDPFLAVLAVPAVSALGLGCALLAGRERSTTGRVGFFLNAVVLGLSVLLLVLAAVRWTSRR